MSESASIPRVGLGRRLWPCFRDGARKGLRTGAWLIAIMVPISLAVALLEYFGALRAVAPFLEPLFRHLGLPPETVLACISGACLSVYSAIAALANIPLTDRQLTILAMMVLVAHNLPGESAIQHKAGTSMWRMALLRIFAALAAALVMNLVLPAGDPTARARGVASAVAAGLGPFLGAWALGTAKLCGMICCIVVGLMILQGILKEFKIMDLLAAPLTPLLWVLGLPRRLAFLWIVANMVGLAYGSGIILEDVRTGALTRKDAQLLNRSMGICHSLLEDTLLFVAIGAWAFWITVPRLALAAAVVWAYRAGAAAWKASGLASAEPPLPPLASEKKSGDPGGGTAAL
jgi:spore maturation protein SpmB